MMSRLPLLAVVSAIFAAGCGSDPAPTPAGPATTLVFSAALSAVNEVPALAATNAEINGRGNATLTMHVTRDAAGNVSSGTIDVLATFTGFPAGTVITLAHIHTGNSTSFGAVVVPMVPNGGEVTMPNGSGSYVHTGFPLPVDPANLIIANPAGFYFNVHSPTNPGGAARGQLALQSQS